MATGLAKAMNAPCNSAKMLLALRAAAINVVTPLATVTIALPMDVAMFRAYQTKVRENKQIKGVQFLDTKREK